MHSPEQEEQDEQDVRLDAWMRLNGRDLNVKSGEAWVCLYVPILSDIAVAKKLAELGIPFFLPLGYDRATDRFEPIWRNYVFCRVNRETRQVVQSRINVTRLLETALQTELLEELIATVPFLNLRKIYQPILGEMVQISVGPFAGQRAFITKADLVKGDRLEVSVELLGKWHHIEVPIRSINRPAHRRELLPLRVKIEEKAADKELNLEICEINRELISYLDKHPDLLYSLPPRKFELLVADIFRASGYDVTVTPQTRDGGADILAVLKTAMGPILTVVECKRYDKNTKVGVDIVERFLFTIREKFRASCGLIATTSSFTQGSITMATNYHWQLQLKDFNGIKGWLSNYGRWTEDRESGLWTPGSLPDSDVSK
jgi:hypothetical protein